MNNRELFEKAKKLVPGGVHSPVRSFHGLHTTPIFVQKAKGAYLYDEEGKEYIDFCMSFGPLILGHKNEFVEEQLQKALDRGWTYGTCEKYSLQLAEFIIDRISFIEQIRFVNSGTEAVMTALRLARGFTGKDKIIKFNGCYHGHTDAMLIKAGSGLAGSGEASSRGIPRNIARDTLVLELNDLEGVKECFYHHGKKIAAIIIEPLPANCGLLRQDKKFLSGLRSLTEENQSLLIFDEVISGFRVGFGGMSEKLGVIPDIVTYGKIIGGGLPVGAIASTKKIMGNLAPCGKVYQAGTLSANPLAMVGGLASLGQLTDAVYQKVEKNSQNITRLFKRWFEGSDWAEAFKDYSLISMESLFWPCPGKDKVHAITDIPQNLNEKFHQLFKVLLSKGIYLSPNAYEVGFVSLAHDAKVYSDLEERLWKGSLRR